MDHQPGPGEHDPRNDVLTSATQAEERKHAKYDRMCAATGSFLSLFAHETAGGHGASTKSVYLLFTKQMRDSGLPADVLVGKLKKDISFALRRGTIAQVTTHQALDDAQRALVRRGRGAPCPQKTRRGLGSLDSLLLFLLPQEVALTCSYYSYYEPLRGSRVSTLLFGG